MEAQQMLEIPGPEVVSNQPPTTLPDRAEGTPYTSVKVISERTSDGQMARHTDIPRRVQCMRKASEEDAQHLPGTSMPLGMDRIQLYQQDLLRKY